MIDFTTILRDLHAEQERINQAIQAILSLREFQSTLMDRPVVPPPTKGTRGRKSMSQEERQVVAERMKNYWQGRRQRTAAALEAANRGCAS